MGSCSGATPAPKWFFRSSQVREKLARSRSSLLTKNARGMPACSAIFHTISAWTSTPSTPEMTKRAMSATRSAAATSPTKSA